MKIALIGQKGIPALSGGVEKHVEKLATRLAAKGHGVYVYVRSHYTDPALTEYQGVTLIHLPSIRTKHFDALTHTFLATMHALFQDYDILHYHSIGPSVLSVIPRIFRPRTRVIATFHSRDYFHKKWNRIAQFLLQWAEKITCTVPEKTIVIGETLRQYAEAEYQKPFICIPNGAEVAHTTDTAALHQWKLRPQRYLLAVSRLVAHKGIHYLIKAFNELEDTNQIPNNFKLVIAGAPANTEDYAAFLRFLIRHRPNVLLVGEQTGAALETLFSHAYLFVQPSEDEGLSIALLEAMGHGLMPVASNIPANREVVGETGALFPSQDVESLKKTLAYFLTRPNEVRDFGKRAEARVGAHYSWDAIAERTLEVYEEAVYRNAHVKESYVSYRTK